MNRPEPDDVGTSDLVRRAQLRSQRAWGLLLSRVDAKLRVLARFGVARLVPHVEVDDVLQDVYIEAARRIDEFEDRGTGSLLRWLAAILRNKAMHVDRGARRRPAVSLDAVMTPNGRDGARLRDALLDASASASRPARRSEMVLRVGDVLEALPEPDREVLLLKHFEGLSGREAAERLGVDESTISLRYRRALERCAARLRGFET